MGSFDGQARCARDGPCNRLIERGCEEKLGHASFSFRIREEALRRSSIIRANFCADVNLADLNNDRRNFIL